MGYRDYDEKTRLPPASRCKQYPSQTAGANSPENMIHNVTILTVTRPDSVEVMRRIYPSKTNQAICRVSAAACGGAVRTSNKSISAI